MLLSFFACKNFTVPLGPSYPFSLFSGSFLLRKGPGLVFSFLGPLLRKGTRHSSGDQLSVDIIFVTILFNWFQIGPHKGTVHISNVYPWVHNPAGRSFLNRHLLHSLVI